MFFLLRLQIKNKEELSYKLTKGVKEDGLILLQAPGKFSAGQWQIEGSKFKQSLFLLLRYGAQGKWGCWRTPEDCINPDNKGADN